MTGLQGGACELMILNLELLDPMVCSQSVVTPRFTTAFDFFASLPEAATVFATTHRPLFPDIPRLLDSTEILAFLSIHHPRPINMKKAIHRVSRNFVADWNSCRGNRQWGIFPWEAITPKEHYTTFYNFLQPSLSPVRPCNCSMVCWVSAHFSACG